MTGYTLATARWRALDREGEDKCRLAEVDHGWLLVGHARFRDDEGFAALDYVVRCDHGWHTLSADIAGTHGVRDIRLVLENDSGEWRLNGHVEPQIAGVMDVDLAFTPATNLMPLRRLAGGNYKALHIRAAWLTYPKCEVVPLDQTYESDAVAGHVSYRAEQTGFTTTLRVDDSGFVTGYPGLWDGEVSHAPV